MDLKSLLSTSIDDLTFSVVDVETTGMNSQFNRVMDVGVVKMKNGKVIETWESLINPQQDIDYWITFYTKLENKHVKHKPVFKFFSEKINNLLKDSIFVAHNAQFDYSFLYQEMKRVDTLFEIPVLCTVLLGRKLLPKLANVHLDALSDYYGIKIINRHRALPDAQATAYVLNEFIKIAKEKYKVKNYFDLQRLQWISVSKNENNDTNLFETLDYGST